MSVSATTSTASAAVAIYDSKVDEQEESEVINDTSNHINNDNTSNNDSSNNNDNDMSNNDVFFQDTWNIMNRRTSQKVGTVAMEDRQFCSFFGAQKEIVKMVWDMLREGNQLVLIIAGAVCNIFIFIWYISMVS